MSLPTHCENPIEILLLSLSDELQELCIKTKLKSSIKKILLIMIRLVGYSILLAN
jgi:hypothetical protein